MSATYPLEWIEHLHDVEAERALDEEGHAGHDITDVRVEVGHADRWSWEAELSADCATCGTTVTVTMGDERDY